MTVSDPNLPATIAEELEILAKVRSGVRKAALAARPDLDAEAARRAVELRDEAAVAHARDLPSLFDQLHVQRSLAERDYSTKLPDMRTPYFAHMRLNENGKRRDILIGHQTFIDTELGVTIIDWRHAPVSRIFFNYRQGDTFCEELPGRVAEGEVELRRVLGFQMGELVRIESVEDTFLLLAEEWIRQDPTSGPELSGGQQQAERGRFLGTGQSGRVMPDISALLDPQQFELLNRSEDDPLLILGSAGCGKTTVALHRIAALNYKNKARFSQQKMLVVVPEEGLVRLSRKLLEGLGLSRVRVSSYDKWIAEQAKYILKSLPTRIYTETPARIVRFKRHPVMLELFSDLEAMRIEAFADQIDDELHFADDLGQRFRELNAPNLLMRVRKMEMIARSDVESSADEGQKKERLLRVGKTFASLTKQIYNLSTDRKALFTDAELLTKAAHLSDGAITESMVKEMVRHSQIQMSEFIDDSAVDVDVERVTTIDGKLVTEDEPEKLEYSIDVEDFSLLFELQRRYTGKLDNDHGVFHTYSHVVIDEAQELAPIELRMLRSSLEADAAVTIAGDSVQQTDPTATFVTWEHVLEQLGFSGVDATHLRTNYRSPRSVTEFAHRVLGPLAPPNMPVAVREGADVTFSSFADEGHASMVVVEALEGLVAREPKASVAIIAYDSESAESFYELFNQVRNMRLVLAGDFSFEPGIDVTEVSQIKGLEFDYVIIPDATEGFYPDRDDARRRLHVAVTRAMHQLWVMNVGKTSSIVQAALANA